MAKRISVTDAIASYGASPLCKVEIESVIRVDPESYRCWLPGERALGKNDELEHSILLRCPGLGRALPLRPSCDEKQTWPCRVTGILVRSYVARFPVMMSPVFGIELTPGGRHRLGVLNVDKVARFPEESVDSSREAIEAGYATVEEMEASMRKFLDEFEKW